MKENAYLLKKRVQELEESASFQKKELVEKQKYILRLEAKLAYYEAPLPPFEQCNCAHRFTDEGICIRCGMDAEEWDAGCIEDDIRAVWDPYVLRVIEEMVEDWQSRHAPESAEYSDAVLVQDWLKAGLEVPTKVTVAVPDEEEVEL